MVLNFKLYSIVLHCNLHLWCLLHQCDFKMCMIAKNHDNFVSEKFKNNNKYKEIYIYIYEDIKIRIFKFKIKN
jgi:phosphopantetheinyl transferase